MIRVLQMIGSLSTGEAQTAIMDIYRNIDRSKIQFDFVLDRAENGPQLEEVKAMGAKLYTMPGFNGVNAAQVKRDWNNFFYMHPEYKLLHCHVTSYASLILPVAKKHEIKTIIHCHSIANGSGAMAMAQNALLYPLKKQADILMASSEEAGRWLYGDKAMKSDRFVLLSKPVDTARYAFSKEKREQARKLLGLENRFILGHAGRFAEPMNHDFLIEVFAKLHERRSDATLLLIGEGSLQRAVAEKAVKLGVAEDVIMTGIRSDIPELLSAMDVFAFPSLLESLPGIVIEAQANGLSCLVSDRISRDADITHQIRHLPPEDAERWAEDLLKNNKRRDVSDSISHSAFDAKNTAIKLAGIYRRLLK